MPTCTALQTNTHTSHIFLHHTNSSTAGRGHSPIQGPRGPHRSPKTARRTPQNDPFSLAWFQMVKVMSCYHKYPHQPHFSSSYSLIYIWEGSFPHPGPKGPPSQPQNSQTYPPK